MSDDNLVERAGRAIYEKSREREGSRNLQLPHWPDMTDEQRQPWLDEGRAAIEAMREPTEAMMRAGRLSGEWMLDSEGDRMDGNAVDVWRAMIDEALKP